MSAQTINMAKIDWNTIDTNEIVLGNQREITRLYHMIYGWLQFLTLSDEEIHHDIFLKVINNINKYNPLRGKLHNFIVTVCINEYKTIKRPKKRTSAIECQLLLDEPKFNYKEEPIEINDIDYEHELNMVLVSIPIEDRHFILNYIHSKKQKGMNDRQRFNRLKKTLKNKYK
jgi:DNA-directed RNA polymerase specialized sigma24 family protein